MLKLETFFTTTKILIKAFTIFFSAQQHYTKKLIQQEFQTSED